MSIALSDFVPRTHFVFVGSSILGGDLAFATALKATRAIDTESRLAPSLIELRVKLP
jgi:hypothetical protein